MHMRVSIVKTEETAINGLWPLSDGNRENQLWDLRAKQQDVNEELVAVCAQKIQSYISMKIWAFFY